MRGKIAELNGKLEIALRLKEELQKESINILEKLKEEESKKDWAVKEVGSFVLMAINLQLFLQKYFFQILFCNVT